MTLAATFRQVPPIMQRQEVEPGCAELKGEAYTHTLPPTQGKGLFDTQDCQKEGIGKMQE